MGNALVHLCPQVSSGRVSKYRRMRISRSDTESAQLCSNEPPIRQNNTVPSPDFDFTTPKGGSQSMVSSTFGPRIMREYLNFPFLSDDELAYWIINTRFMFILRGPPGSGKSYIAECLKLRYPNAHVCSADDFWYLESDGLEYQFDVSRIAEAHQWCQNMAYKAVESGISPVVIDNTNVRAWETRYYTDLARKFDYLVIMVTPQTPWRFDADTLTTRNVHFVSYHTIEAKVRNFEHVFPLYYGWLWPGPGSVAGHNRQSAPTKSTFPDCWPLNETQNLLSWAWDSLVTIVSLPDVHVQLASALSLSDDSPITSILRHWRSATQPPFGIGLKHSPAASVPHITARFARFGRTPGAEQYGLSAAVTETLLGRLFTVQVTGLYFSLRTIGVRIRLPADDLVLRHLWGSDDQATLSAEEPMLNGGSQCAASRSRPVGCRAHVTLALASDVPAVETGFDLLRIVDAELADQPGEHVAIIPGGSVRRVTVRKPVSSPTRLPALNFLTAPPGCEYMYVYDLDFPEHHRVLFAASY